MKSKIIKAWHIFLIIYLPLSIVFNFISITIFKDCFHIVNISMPVPDAEVTEVFNKASPDLVASRTFSYRLQDRYFVLIETTKEGKEMLENLK